MSYVSPVPTPGDTIRQAIERQRAAQDSFAKLSEGEGASGAAAGTGATANVGQLPGGAPVAPDSQRGAA